jgi:protein-S-isoprenylcysteine O-methyltransferase Ste14
MNEVALSKPRVLPPKGLLIALASQVPLLWAALPLRPSVVEVALGAVLCSIGVCLNVWADALFRRNDVGVCPFTHVPVVVEGGPYRITRNPMYVGLVCLNLGVTFFTGVLGNIWSSIALLLWLHYAFVLPEEQFLRRNLAAIYDRYSKRAPRWLIY